LWEKHQARKKNTVSSNRKKRRRGEEKEPPKTKNHLVGRFLGGKRIIKKKGNRGDLWKSLRPSTTEKNKPMRRGHW